MFVAFWIIAGLAGFSLGYGFRWIVAIAPPIIGSLILIALIVWVNIHEPHEAAIGTVIYLAYVIPGLVAYAVGGIVGAYIRRKELGSSS